MFTTSEAVKKPGIFVVNSISEFIHGSFKTLPILTFLRVLKVICQPPSPKILPTFNLSGAEYSRVGYQVFNHRIGLKHIV